MARFIFLTLLAVGAFSLWRLTKSNHGRASQRLVFFGFLVLVAVAVLWPDSATAVANLVGIGRGADLVLYLTSFGLMFLAALTFLKTKRTDERIAHLVSEQAADEAVREWDQAAP